jgi:hypothetical protein
MPPKRRKQEKPQASSPLDEQARVLAEKRDKLLEEIERNQRLIERQASQPHGWSPRFSRCASGSAPQLRV